MQAQNRQLAQTGPRQGLTMGPTASGATQPAGAGAGAGAGAAPAPAPAKRQLGRPSSSKLDRTTMAELLAQLTSMDTSM